MGTLIINSGTLLPNSGTPIKKSGVLRRKTCMEFFFFYNKDIVKKSLKGGR